MKQGGMRQVVQPRRVEGNAEGNREERRMAKKLERKKGTGRDRVEDQGDVRKVT